MDDVDWLAEYCEFGPERVYLLVAVARAKDDSNPDGSSAHVLREVVEDADGLARGVARLDHAVRRFDRRYRLYVSANPRDVTAAFFRLRERMDDWLEMRFNGNEEVIGKFGRIDREFESVLQTDGCRDETNFLFDLDGVTERAAAEFADRLAAETTVRCRRETPNGYHVVSEPFDYTAFDADVDYELKTDGLLFVSFLGE